MSRLDSWELGLVSLFDLLGSDLASSLLMKNILDSYDFIHLFIDGLIFW